MEANGRLERSANEGLVARGILGVEGWQTAGLNALTTAGLNALTANACGQSAWWKLPRGILGV